MVRADRFNVDRPQNTLRITQHPQAEVDPLFVTLLNLAKSQNGVFRPLNLQSGWSVTKTGRNNTVGNTFGAMFNTHGAVNFGFGNKFNTFNGNNNVNFSALNENTYVNGNGNLLHSAGDKNIQVLGKQNDINISHAARDGFIGLAGDENTISLDSNYADAFVLGDRNAVSAKNSATGTETYVLGDNNKITFEGNHGKLIASGDKLQVQANNNQGNVIVSGRGTRVEANNNIGYVQLGDGYGDKNAYMNTFARNNTGLVVQWADNAYHLAEGNNVVNQLGNKSALISKNNRISYQYRDMQGQPAVSLPIHPPVQAIGNQFAYQKASGVKHIAGTSWESTGVLSRNNNVAIFGTDLSNGSLPGVASHNDVLMEGNQYVSAAGSFNNIEVNNTHKKAILEGTDNQFTGSGNQFMVLSGSRNQFDLDGTKGDDIVAINANADSQGRLSLGAGNDIAIGGYRTDENGNVVRTNTTFKLDGGDGHDIFKFEGLKDAYDIDEKSGRYFHRDSGNEYYLKNFEGVEFGMPADLAETMRKEAYDELNKTSAEIHKQSSEKQEGQADLTDQKLTAADAAEGASVAVSSEGDTSQASTIQQDHNNKDQEINADDIKVDTGSGEASDISFEPVSADPIVLTEAA